LVGGDEHAASLVAPADELKEQVRGLLLERQVAELVDDQVVRPERLRWVEICALYSVTGCCSSRSRTVRSTGPEFGRLVSSMT
jgi:hypothetical protein